jgi:hypothetical protein
MEQIIYQQSPYIPTAYPESVEAYNYKDWQGWQSTPGRGGGVFFTSPVMASYLTVHPVSIAIVIAMVVVVVVVALRRPGRRSSATS